MKILNVLKRNEGGVGRYVRELGRELKLKGHTIVNISREDDLGSVSFLGSIFKLRKKVNNEKYDILHTHDWSVALPLIGLKNHVCTFHGLSPNFPANLLQKLVYQILGKKVIVVGDSLKKKFPKAELIYEGIDLNFFKPSDSRKKNRKFRIGFVQNRFDKTYRFDIISSAVGSMKNAELIVAEGLPETKMPAFYNTLDAVISLPDERAGFNLCWLEAMACNLKVIGNGSGIGEKLPIIRVPEPPSEKEIVQAVETAMKAGKTDYRVWLKREKFGWENCAESVARFYEKL